MSTSSVSATSHMLCVVRGTLLRRTLRRTLNACGSPVEFRDSIDDADPGPVTILVVDREGWKSADPPALVQVLGDGGRIVILGHSLADLESIEMLRNQAHDHLISEATPDEVELIVTTVKLLSGDIFGLEKYMPWGVVVTESEVSTFEDKRSALRVVASAAEKVGARRHLISKIECAADELLMNALYDAPATQGVRNPDIAGAIRSGNVPLDPNGASAVLRYANDGRYFALSVMDHYGALEKQAVIDNLVRARHSRGEPREEGGAGLGLYFVLSSVTRFIVNVEPGVRTEVVCLFDLRERGKEADAWARSLHIFKTE